MSWRVLWSRSRCVVPAMRVPYHAEDTSLSEADLVSKEPFKNFEHWFKEAVASKGEMEANSMAVATADRSVQTAVRGWEGGGAGVEVTGPCIEE